MAALPDARLEASPAKPAMPGRETETPGMAPRPFRVVRRARETHDTWTLDLEPVLGRPLEVEPGQFTMLYAFGVGEVPISVSGPPLVQTIRAVGPVTRALCAARPGTVIGVRGPFGTHWPVEDVRGRDVLIVAGGVGLPPVRPALYHVLEHRADYGRVVLLYGARTPEDIVFRREIERWRSRMDLDVDVTVDAATGDWRGKVGVVTTLIPRAHLDPDATAAFVVGPEIMMRFTARALVDAGLEPGQIWLSMERTMKCGVGLCGHCQYGPSLVCRDGAVYPYPAIERLLGVREL
jgi:NAD(P)H-flavin reductase